LPLQAPKNTSFKVLVAPLDWGLGHAARCIPLITALKQQHCEVVLAADGAAAELLKTAFPELRLLPLKGYRVRYSRSGGLMPLILLWQLPHMLATMQNEKKWLARLLEQEKFQLVISDNRPGLWNKNIISIYITHQLHIISGMGKWIDRFLFKVHQRVMRNFEQVWVPDIQGTNALAGILSNPHSTGKQPIYIGPVSRFKVTPGATKDIQMLIVLSGPEPQRSILEKKLLKDAHYFNGNIVLVRGKENAASLPYHKNITVVPLASADTLHGLLLRSKLVVCRSGYTSVMDLLRLHAKAVLVPTPKQTEQVYLAERMQEKGYFPWISQNEITLSKAIERASEFQYCFPYSDADFEQHHQTIIEMIASVKDE